MFIRSKKDGTDHTTGFSSQFSFASLIARLFHTSVISGLNSIVVLWIIVTFKKKKTSADKYCQLHSCFFFLQYSSSASLLIKRNWPKDRGFLGNSCNTSRMCCSCKLTYR